MFFVELYVTFRPLLKGQTIRKDSFEEWGRDNFLGGG